MVRAILGVIVGFFVGGILVFGLFLTAWFVFGVDGMLEKGTYYPSMALNIGAPLASILGSLAGGWVCRKISRSRTAVFVLASILFVAGLGFAVAGMSKPEPGARPTGQTVMEAIQSGKMPDWFAFLKPCLEAGGVLLGGCCLACCKKK